MNRQQGANRIGWTDYTWNPIAGCLHGCRWIMPDGTEAICYADTTASGVARHSYKEGFAHYYWHPRRLNEPLEVKALSKIFPDSMSDMLGHWVPKEHILKVIEIMRKASWHAFQPLTKNPKRYLEFDWPLNVWAGFSVPPSYMNGHYLEQEQQKRLLEVSLETMRQVKVPITWSSIEPLSWDCAELFRDCGLKWAVIGAASNGPEKHQPDSGNLERLLTVLDAQKIPVYFKENLTYTPRREEFPSVI